MKNSDTVLVTGGAGYIGSHIILALLERGYKVIVLDNLSTGSKSSVPDSVPLFIGDVADYNLIRNIYEKLKFDSVIHLAGSIVPSDSLRYPLSYYDNNVSKTISLLIALEQIGVQNIIFSSSAAVYGNTDNKKRVAEQEPCNPVTPYGSSKLIAEQVLHDLATSSEMRYIALRYFNVAGADPKGRAGQIGRQSTHLIKSVVETVLGDREELLIYGSDYDTPDGTCIRDYIHVSDLAIAHTCALEYLVTKRENQILNCGYASGNSVLEVVSATEEVTGQPLKVRIGERRAGDLPVVVADNSKLLSILNWTPQYKDLKLIIKSELDWKIRLLHKSCDR